MTDFDPFAYAADVKANPQNYVLVSYVIAECMALHKIRNAKTLQALKQAFQAPAKAAKASGDTELSVRLTDAATQRKNELGGTK